MQCAVLNDINGKIVYNMIDRSSSDLYEQTYITTSVIVRLASWFFFISFYVQQKCLLSSFMPIFLNNMVQIGNIYLWICHCMYCSDTNRRVIGCVCVSRVFVGVAVFFPPTINPCDIWRWMTPRISEQSFHKGRCYIGEHALVLYTNKYQTHA